jgi:hypothetical protein
VKYLLLIYQNPTTWWSLPDSERHAFMSVVGYCIGVCASPERAVMEPAGDGSIYASSTKGRARPCTCPGCLA